MTSLYDDAELDREILRSRASNWSVIATRVIVLAVTFFFLARAVAQGATAGFLLLPLGVELASILWLGLILGYVLVDCPRFIETTRRPGRVLFWTSLILGAFCLVLGWESGRGFDVARIRPGWASAWQEVLRTGVIWAMLAEVLGLLVATAREVADWRRTGGVFLWRSAFAPSFRIAAVVLLGLFSPFVLIPLADSALPWLLGNAQRMAWAAFGFLFLVELGALGLSVGLHRSVSAESEQRAR